MKGKLIVFGLKFLSWLPLSVARHLGDLLGSMLFRLNGRMAQTTRINIEICLSHLSADEVSELTKKSLQETCKTVMEGGAVWFWPVDKVLEKVRVKNRELLEQAVSKGKGVILVAPHHGNWEVIGIFLGKHGAAPNINLYQAPASKALDELIRKARSRGNSSLAPTTSRGVATLIKGLKRGEIVGILPDQVPAETGGEYAPFFDRPALTMSLVTRLIAKTDCSALLTYTRRIEGEKGIAFEVVFKPVDERLFSEDQAQSLQGLNATVEMAVSDNPAIYQWEYKRFRRQPEGLDRPY